MKFSLHIGQKSRTYNSSNTEEKEILNKQKSTQSEDCLIYKLFRMTCNGKEILRVAQNDAALPSPLEGERICGRTNEVSPDSEQIEHTVAKATIAKLCERGTNSRQGCFPVEASLKPGKQGEGFIEHTLSRISNIRQGLMLKFYPPHKAYRVTRCTAFAGSLCITKREGNNNNVTDISRFTFHVSQKKRPKRKAAFTLAEVLITLGIIGVVAAMTMPTLIQKHRKTVAETGLKKFYTTMNQAIQLSVNDNGETKYWEFLTGSEEYSPEANKQFYNKYFKKYLKTLKTDIIPVKFLSGMQDLFTIIFTDGSAVAIGYRGHDWYYCTKATDLPQYVDKNGTGCFTFGFYPSEQWNASPYTTKVYYNKGIEPYVQSAQIQVGTDENGNPIYEAPSEDNLYEGKFYAKAIQLNGWRIPDDYPLKF